MSVEKQELLDLHNVVHLYAVEVYSARQSLPVEYYLVIPSFDLPVDKPGHLLAEWVENRQGYI